MTRILIFIIISILISNIKILGQQKDFFENQRKKLNNILLEGDLKKLVNYFEIHDSLQTSNSMAINHEKKIEYSRIKQKYLSLANKIELISNKSEKEIKKSYSYFIPIQNEYKKKLVSKNAIKAFEKFVNFYNRENYSEAAKYLNISFFLNTEKKFLSYDEFSNVMLEFSEEISNLETSIDCGDLDNAFYYENKLDSLSKLLPDSAQIDKKKYFLLKEELEKQKNIENNFLCSAEDVFKEPSFSFNLAALLDHSSEMFIPLNVMYRGTDNNYKGLEYFYNIPSGVGPGLSLSFGYKIINSFYIGIEAGFFKYKYDYIGVFLSSRDDEEQQRYSPDFYGYTDFNMNGKFYNLYIQYKFPNRTIFHPFVRFAYGQVFTEQSLSEAQQAPIFYNKINNAKTNYNEFRYGLGVEVYKYFSDKVLISLLYSRKVRFSDPELTYPSSGTFEVILSYYW